MNIDAQREKLGVKRWTHRGDSRVRVEAYTRGCVDRSKILGITGNHVSRKNSCLENPRDRGAWWAAVYGVAESDTTEAT